MTLEIKDKLKWRLENELEIYLLLLVFGAWYFLNLDGAMRADETIWAWQGYFFYKGNMPAEQFRPMGRYFFGLGQILFGRTTFGAKFFIPIFGVLTIYLTYKCAKILSNRISGFVSALILGIIPFYGDIFVSARLDGILTFFGMLLFYMTLKWHKTHNIIIKQRLLFIVGILSICTLATKLYGVFFSLVVFVFFLKIEWKTIRTIELFKRKNMKIHFRKNIFLLPIFTVLGVLFGLLMRAQLKEFWDQAGDKGRSDVLGLLPEYLDNIILNMESTGAYVFFIIIGVIIFLLFWALSALVGRYCIRTLRHLKKREALDMRYNPLIYFTGAIIGFVIIYLPYILNPVAFLTNSLLVQSINLGDSSSIVIEGVEYDRAPWWAYMYWSYVHLGLVFVIGILIAIFYTIFKYIKKEKIEKGQKFLFFYTFVTFTLLSALSQRVAVYFIILFPLFSIFAVLNLANILGRLLTSQINHSLKEKFKWLSPLIIMIIILIPGPVLMVIEDPSLGYDSEYDKAGNWVENFVDSNDNETIYIIAYDRFALEFYLSDEILKRCEIIPLFSDNYSVDALGHENVYYPESILYNMTVLGTIDLLVDELRFEDDTQSTVRNYIRSNSTRVEIENELVIYIL